MNQQFLDFEQPIAELQAKIEELRMLGSDSELNISDEIERLEKKLHDKSKSIFAKLQPWQIVQMARHPLRPHSQDYIDNIFTDFNELHGDRHYSNAPAIIGGLARLDGQTVMVLGHQKGRRTKEKVYRNFGMARPEDYRKALRLMKMAEKYHIPIVSFIDTSGAYPGIGAEERNQSEAIARNLFEMSDLRTPIICTVIGEGGSGGALAIGVGDHIMMLQYSIYSTISPEGCASILWKNADKASDAAVAMGITSDDLLKHGLIDEVIAEPLGGAHRDQSFMFDTLKSAIGKNLQRLVAQPIDKVLDARYQKLMAFGAIK